MTLPIMAFTVREKPIFPLEFTVRGLTDCAQITVEAWQSSGASELFPLGVLVQPPILPDSFVHFHEQPEAASIWSIYHGLGHLPDVTIYDSAGDEIKARVQHDNINQATITFSEPVAGKARID